MDRLLAQLWPLAKLTAAVPARRKKRIFASAIAGLALVAITGFGICRFSPVQPTALTALLRSLSLMFQARVSLPITPTTAKKEAPFVNSLGMKFVPVEITGGPTDGKRLLFSVWDTRVQDYAEYAKAKGITLVKPEFDQGPAHPAVMVSWDDAKAFCVWLTEKERGSRMIGGQDQYQLPSDHEWSCAVGIGRLEKPEMGPRSKGESEMIKLYPWRKDWPPPKQDWSIPKRAGNYDPKALADEFKFTSPVGSFEANENGLYDMGGNVWQWCEDWYDTNHNLRVVRGASWNFSDEIRLKSSYRGGGIPFEGSNCFGFRCVLEVFGG